MMKDKLLIDVETEIKDNRIQLTPYIFHPEKQLPSSKVVLEMLENEDFSVSYHENLELIYSLQFKPDSPIPNFYIAYSILNNLNKFKYMTKQLYYTDVHLFNILHFLIKDLRENNKMKYFDNKYISIYNWYIKAFSNPIVSDNLFEIYLYNKRAKEFMELSRQLNNGELMDRVIKNDLKEAKRWNYS